MRTEKAEKHVNQFAPTCLPFLTYLITYSLYFIYSDFDINFWLKYTLRP